MGLISGCKATVIVLAAAFCLGGAALAQQVRPGLETGRLADQAPRPPDPARGETLFKECRKCHEVTPGRVKIGPSLAAVVGRRAGSVPGFGYSRDMIDLGAAGTVWDDSSLDRFLTRPRAMVAGTKMVFQGFRKQADRDDLIAFLSTI
ncbi:MAG: cytochrome c family protein [Rhizobiales bacterium]|nr:cytochrome c family protein [Hyphomicrobiales bacterium]